MSRRPRRRGHSLSPEKQSPPNHEQAIQSRLDISRQEWLATIVLAALCGLLVWAAYQPADSIALEQGDALGWCAAALATSLLGILVLPTSATNLPDRTIDCLAICLASWMVFAAWWTSSGAASTTGDLRASMNEAWWWCSAAAIFVMARRLFAMQWTQKALVGSILFSATMLSVHTLHQANISLPQTLADYEADPEGTLALIGLTAEQGSAQRMIFENRLRDGGPTATFALANTLAGYLVLGCILVWTCLVRRLVQPTTRLGWLTLTLAIVMATMFTALWSTGSRSGQLAVVMVCAGYVSWLAAGVSARTWLPKVIPGVLSVFAIAGAAFWFFRERFDQSEWISQAPATLQLRWQYWVSTFDILNDHPLTGAGPGNFQATYQRYRHPNAHETIAEPHNFFMETLAAGGWIAGALLLALLCFLFVTRHRRRTNTAESSPVLFRLGSFTAAAGTVAAIVGVWIIGISNGELPDFDANQFALPLALAVAGTWWFVPQQSNLLGQSNLIGPSNLIGQTNPVSPTAMLTAIGIHWCVSGGMTVPGVASAAWVLAAMMLPGSISTSSSTFGHIRKTRFDWISVGGFAIALVSLLAFSYLPLRRGQDLTDESTDLLRRGQTTQARKVLHQAVQTDPYAFDPAMWLLEIAASSPVGDTFEKSIQSARQRAFGNPARHQAISETLVRSYQTSGERATLEQAWQSAQVAVQLSPTHQSILAQAAEIAREREERFGVKSGVRQLANRASESALAGGVITRSLHLQSILVARPFGEDATELPIRRSASEALSTFLDD